MAEQINELKKQIDELERKHNIFLKLTRKKTRFQDLTDNVKNFIREELKTQLEKKKI